jgi:hypothetical protein
MRGRSPANTIGNGDIGVCIGITAESMFLHWSPEQIDCNQPLLNIMVQPTCFRKRRK